MCGNLILLKLIFALFKLLCQLFIFFCFGFILARFDEFTWVYSQFFLQFRNIPKQLEKLVFDCVGQPLNFNPPASPNLFKLSCFGAINAWFKFMAAKTL